MNSRFNPNPSPLDSLTEAQHQQLLDWLEAFPTPEVVRMVRRDPPEGFGIITHVTTLNRYWARQRASLMSADVQLANEIVSGEQNGAPFEDATAASVRRLAFELSNSPRSGAKQFKALSRWVLKLNDLALARERLELERQKFEFNAARQALNHLAGLSAISADPKMDDEDKIRAARQRIFGSAP